MKLRRMDERSAVVRCPGVSKSSFHSKKITFDFMNGLARVEKPHVCRSWDVNRQRWCVIAPGGRIFWANSMRSAMKVAKELGRRKSLGFMRNGYTYMDDWEDATDIYGVCDARFMS